MHCISRSFPDLDSLSRAAAEYIIYAANEEIRTRSRFALALSGGDTPRTLYSLLASERWSERMPWTRTHVFWGDERCVPPESGESNFHSARELLLSRVPIPDGNIHRIPAERGGEAAAAIYQRELEDFFLSPGAKSDYFPVFDCLLLGVGGDGHLASLFPGTRALEEDSRWVAPATAPDGISPRERVTLTLPSIDRAKRLLFLVSGAGKRHVLRGVFDTSPGGSVLPVSRVKPRGECVFFMDFAL
jgi:6-phosphogluconolactonase